MHRTETRGGNFYDYHYKSLPKGSPLSPLLGAIALYQFRKITDKPYPRSLSYLRRQVSSATKCWATRPLYEPSHGYRNVSRQNKRNPHGRDMSEYQVNESAPTEEEVHSTFSQLWALTAQAPDTLAILWKYIGQWARWLRLGLSTIKAFEECVQMLLPSVFACWAPGARLFTSANCL